MKRKLLLGLSIILVASGLFLLAFIVFSFKNAGKGALQVTANIKSKVFLDGKYIGDTQLCKCDQNQTIATGNYELRIEPTDTTYPAYTARIKINGGVLTAVDRTFLPSSLASAYILTLEKSNLTKPELIITTIPDGAMVTIDSVPLGATPYKSDSLSSSEHEIEIQKQGFAKKTIRIKTVDGHKLTVKAQLGTEGSEEELLQPTKAVVKQDTKTQPTPTVTAAKITVLDTPNGFLRVRSGPGTSNSEVGRVKPGEIYDVLKEDSGWYQITLSDKTEGWVSSQFASKN